MVWTSGRTPFPFQGVSGGTNHQTHGTCSICRQAIPPRRTPSVPEGFILMNHSLWRWQQAAFSLAFFPQALPVQDVAPGKGKESARWASQKHSEFDPRPSYSETRFWSTSPAGVNQHHCRSMAESGAWPPSPLQGAGTSLISSDRISALVTSVFLSQSRRFAFISTLLHPADPGHNLKTPSMEWQDLTVTFGAKSLLGKALLCHMSNPGTRTHLRRPAHGWATSSSCLLWQQQETHWLLSHCLLCSFQQELSNDNCRSQSCPNLSPLPSLPECFLSQQIPILLHLHHTEQHQKVSVLGVHTTPCSWITLFASFVEAGMGKWPWKE